ncbi:MAG: hypothetical protein ACP5NV_06145 [Candidatus Woesearchaeota archaeon]
MSKDKRIFIDTTRPEQFLGHEFYLVIAARDRLFKDTYEKINKNMGIIKKAIHATRGLVGRLLKQEKEDIRNCDGSIIEVTERKPHTLKGYSWPAFNRAIYDNEIRVATTIPVEETFRSYIFVPNIAKPTDELGYKIIGTMRSYDLHTNSVGELEEKVTIEYKKTPKYKENAGSVRCF